MYATDYSPLLEKQNIL